MKTKTHTPLVRSWIEANFQKRECAKFIPNAKDEQRCCCGRPSTHHGPNQWDLSKELPPADTWVPSKHTRASPTDAYGTLEFQGGPHPTKAEYIRVSYDARPEVLLQLFTREWGLELPKLLITVQGGKANFELQPKLKKILRKGLSKAAKTTGAWIFTGGTNTGVTRQVGDALLLERSQRSGRVITLGIAPWGIVENNHDLIGANRDVPYHSISSPRSKFAALNNRHAYFLLVDNGTQGRYGAEICLRRKLEKFISIQRLNPYTFSSIPVVCLVIEGGTNTIRAVLEYVTDNPPVPVVVCDGSGRAADLIAFVHKYASDSESGEQVVLEAMKEYLLNMIQRTFEVGEEQAIMLYGELLQCTRRKHLITVFRICERGESRLQELDQIILIALLKSQQLTPSEQLSLSLTWNRVDIARSEIFVYGQEWPPGALQEAMMQALEHDKIDFVKLLLENGVTMRKFLTIPRLEELYNTKHGPSNTLGYILRDVRPHIPRGYVYTLHDIGLVINKLMGGAYRALYTRRKFRPIYAKVMNKTPCMHRHSTSYAKQYGNTMTLLAEALPNNSNWNLFDFPFNELLIWAVLMKRQKMALLMWQHGEEALAKALVACKLYKAMAHEAAEDDMETEVYEELRSYAKEFENIALELLDYCYRQDDDQTQQLLTCELQNWSGQTCLSLAVAANHRALLAHPCSQIILADLWMGGLRTRKNTNLKVILGLLFPPYICGLEFKSREELQLMPQTEEEHLELENDDDHSEQSIDGEPPLRTSSFSNHHSLKRKPVPLRPWSYSNQQSFETLLSQEFTPKDTVVQENGTVLPDLEETKYFSFDGNFPEKTRQMRPLKLKKKIYEFFTAPITKFWANSISYLLFLIIFSYTVLVKMAPTPSWQEILAISYIGSLGCEKIREILCSEPVAISHKFAVWAWNMWNPCDAAAIIFFLIGLSLRLQQGTMDVGRVIYCVDSIYWYLRILNILGVNKYLGPLVTMMGKMVKNMIYFVVLLLVVLMSFGVCRQAILFPNKEPSWSIARDVFFEPYFMLYGEVFADGIDPHCGDDPDLPNCLTGRWINPAVMSVYLLIANILLINLLIAVFNNIFNEVNAISHQVWMFQRFTVVMEYEQKPILPPPFIIICHIFLLFKYCRRKMNGIRETYDNGLKLFLEKEDMDRLYDFEEDCVEGYFAEQDLKLQQSMEDRIRVTTDRVENLSQKVEDINTKENSQTSAMQNVEFRLRKVEDTSQDILRNLAVIHRFMATSSPRSITTHNEDIFIPPITIEPERPRRASERSTDAVPSATSDESHLSVQQAIRKKPIRSLTEVRPDAYIFDDGAHVEVRTLREQEEDECGEQRDMDVLSSAGSRKQLNLMEERQRSVESKTSIETGTDNNDEVDQDFLSTDDLAALTIDALRMRSLRRRDSTGTARRSSEGGDDSINDSRANLLITRRQFSQTQSEPDCIEPPPQPTLLTSRNLPLITTNAPQTTTNERSVTFAEPRINVVPPPPNTLGVATSGQQDHSTSISTGTGSGGGARDRVSSRKLMLQHMHTEYTSITDELESVCGLLSPPRTPRLLSPPRPKGMNLGVLGTGSGSGGGAGSLSAQNSLNPPMPHRRRHASEMSNPEMALFIEKEHLRDAEESDYMLMEDLIHRRGAPTTDDDTTDSDGGGGGGMYSQGLLSVVNESLEYQTNRYHRSSLQHGRSLRRASAVMFEDEIGGGTMGGSGFGGLFGGLAGLGGGGGGGNDGTERRERADTLDPKKHLPLTLKPPIQPTIKQPPTPPIVPTVKHLPPPPPPRKSVRLQQSPTPQQPTNLIDQEQLTSLDNNTSNIGTINFKGDATNLKLNNNNQFRMSNMEQSKAQLETHPTQSFSNVVGSSGSSTALSDCLLNDLRGDEGSMVKQRPSIFLDGVTPPLPIQDGTEIAEKLKRVDSKGSLLDKGQSETMC